MTGREFFTARTVSAALAGFRPARRTAIENVALAAALGRVPAADIVAPDALPGFRRSTVDGYAVRAADTYGASEGLSTVAVDDVAIGGQAGTSSRIENYLGFPAGITGSELVIARRAPPTRRRPPRPPPDPLPIHIPRRNEPTMRRHTRAMLALLAATALVAGACGGGDDGVVGHASSFGRGESASKRASMVAAMSTEGSSIHCTCMPSATAWSTRASVSGGTTCSMRTGLCAVCRQSE